MREQRFVFGEVAELYERVRPAYPAAAVDRVLELGAPARYVLEIGAGTGKLTRLLAARGVDVTALEPNREMAGVAARECVDLPVTLVPSTFEAWDGPSAHYDVVAAAQSWHWVPSGARVEAAAHALRAGGVLALLWNIPERRRSPLHDQIEDAYARHAPDVELRSLYGAGSATGDFDADLAASSDFGPRHEEDFVWAATYDRDTWLDLSRTQSGHRMLDDEVLTALLRDVGTAIDAHGGEITVHYSTKLVWSRRT